MIEVRSIAGGKPIEFDKTNMEYIPDGMITFSPDGIATPIKGKEDRGLDEI